MLRKRLPDCVRLELLRVDKRNLDTVKTVRAYGREKPEVLRAKVLTPEKGVYSKFDGVVCHVWFIFSKANGQMLRL
jgi:hypothetical protein